MLKSEDETGGVCSTHEAHGKCIQREPGRTRPLGRTRRRWQDNIKLDSIIII
jgi:hypothetical protein